MRDTGERKRGRERGNAHLSNAWNIQGTPRSWIPAAVAWPKKTIGVDAQMYSFFSPM